VLAGLSLATIISHPSFLSWCACFVHVSAQLPFLLPQDKLEGASSTVDAATLEARRRELQQVGDSPALPTAFSAAASARSRQASFHTFFCLLTQVV